ncbi:MAG: hypothetical protein JWQ35_1874, partial [Bacteriovoracaceae bacterium]|nr:hypothetical protein [Bacteriovoracaceae bacterium]
LSGCGNSESSTAGAGPNFNASSASNFKIIAFNPLTYALNPASPNDPNTLVAASNLLQLFEYDAIIQPDLDVTKTQVTDFVTGVGIDVNNLANPAVRLDITIGVEARQFDSTTGNFSSTTQIFTDHQGADVGGAQNFVILNKNSPNYFLTGLGLKLKYAVVSNLVLQRKTLDQINNSGTSIDSVTGKSVTLPNGWAAVGFFLKITNNPAATLFPTPTPLPGLTPTPTPTPTPSTIPFVQDAVLYVGQLVAK